MPGAEKEAVTIEPWAAGIGLGTLVLVGCVAAFTAWERMGNSNAGLETVITPTAVGDTHYVQPPVSGTGSIGIKYQGQKLDMVTEDKVRDSKVLRVGNDDSGVYSLYRPEVDKDLAKERFYMKVKTNDFMEVTGE